MKITKRQLRRIIKEELLRESQWQDNYDSWTAQRDATASGGKYSSHPDVDQLAAAVQTIVDSGSSAIMDMDRKLQGMGYENAEYLSGAGLRMVQIPMGPGASLVVISKNAVEPDGETAIVGPYAVGLMT